VQRRAIVRPAQTTAANGAPRVEDLLAHRTFPRPVAIIPWLLQPWLRQGAHRLGLRANLLDAQPAYGLRYRNRGMRGQHVGTR
jgi:hypothetical protein